MPIALRLQRIAPLTLYRLRLRHVDIPSLQAADIWSCGMLLLAMLAGEVPQGSGESLEINIPSNLSEGCRSLIQRMLAKGGWRWAVRAGSAWVWLPAVLHTP